MVSFTNTQRDQDLSKNNELHGWWKLVSFKVETHGSKELQQPFGEHAVGRIVFSPNGQMIAVITAEGRASGPSDADHIALYNSMLAYTGKYRIEGEKFITTVDASWNEAWTGTEQERTYKINDNCLDIVSAWAAHPMDENSPPVRGILSWCRES